MAAPRSRTRAQELPESPDTSWELQLGHPRRAVAGVDEVGRGCLAGPVTAGAVVLPETIDFEAHPWLAEVTDSKKLKAETRERLEPLIQGWARSWAVASATVEEIDRINIHHASHLAMVRAVDALSVKPEAVLVDGKFPPKQMKGEVIALVKGDLRCLSIACASILAKVWRDRYMTELEAKFPGYGLAVHKGYPTPAHQEALRKLGPREIHRRSFTLPEREPEQGGFGEILAP